MDSTGDFLTLVPLLDTVNIPASPTPSSTGTTARSVLSATTTNTAVTSTAGVASSPARRLRLDSLFNTRRGYHVPLVSLTVRKDGSQHTAPPAPAPVSLGPADWRSWLGGLVGSGSTTGDEIDILCMWTRSLPVPLASCNKTVLIYLLSVAGPDRPIPEKPEPAEHMAYKEWEAASNKAGATASSVERSRNNLYDRLHATISERGSVFSTFFSPCVC